MAKALRTAAIVVGVGALIATGVGAAVGAGIIGGVAAGAAAGTAATFAGLTAASLASIGALAGTAAALLSFGASAAAPKPSIGGRATAFKIDKDAGIPIVFGRTYVGGNVIHRQYYGTKNSLESWVTALSLGPVKSVGPLLIDKAAVTFVGGAAQGTYNGFMWLDTQLGACPETRVLAGPSGSFPGWGADSKLSGLAADLWTLRYDGKDNKYQAGVPQRGRVVEGVFAWDPRLDDTVPGGSGPCRLDDPSTHIWTENPWLLAIQFAYGFIQNGQLVAGGGLQVTGIDLVRFIEAANYADLVGWKAGGLVYTTADNDWEILKLLAQAGGGEVMPIAGLLSCTFSAPRVSIGTITSADIAGDIDVPSTASMRTRRNTVIPRVRLESHGWEVLPIDAITVEEYVAVDGGVRPREIEMPLVQDVDLGAKLGVLKMLDDRELDGITLPLKVYALGYLPGDALDVDVPEANLTDRQVVVRTREIDAPSLGVTLTCRSETPGKHPFALAASGTPPPTPDLSVPPFFPAVSARAAYQIIRRDVAYPVTSTSDTVTVTAFNGTLDDGRIIAFPSGELTGLTNAESYLVLYAVDDVEMVLRTDDGALTTGSDDVPLTTTVYAGSYIAVPAPGLEEAALPGFAIVRDVTTANADNTYPPETPPPPGDGGGGYGGGGACPTEDMPFLTANADRTGPGFEIPAGSVTTDTWAWTQHERTGEWGAFRVTAVSKHLSPVVLAWSGHLPQALPGYPVVDLRASPDHRIGGTPWRRMRDVGRPDGEATVVKITVAGAHTYVAAGVLSHNAKQIEAQQ